MTPYENLLRTYRFEHPAWIPCTVAIPEQAWLSYPREEIAWLVGRHPALFPGLDPDAVDTSAMPRLPWQRAGVEYVDSWGAVWRTSTDGVTGVVQRHPLETWDAFDEFTPPDPARENGWGPVDWQRQRAEAARARREGRRVPGAQLRHGHTFLTLEYLRGLENLVYDMYDEHPNLVRLVEMVERFNQGYIDLVMDLEPDIVGFPEDLGAQTSSLLSPELFRRWIKPSYERLMAKPKAAGAVVHMHCDGYVLDIIDDLLACGMDVLNIQDLIHGIDTLRETLVGRVALELDVDRQNVTVFGTENDVRDLIREEIDKLATPAGGLALKFGMYPPVPVRNVDAMCDAMEAHGGIG